MSAYLKLGDIQGESTHKDHKDWIELDSVSSAVSRSIAGGAKGIERARGQTALSDIAVSRPLDKSSVKIAEACAKGEFYPEAEIHICTKIKGKEEPVLKYKLKNVVIGNYSISAGNLSESDVPQSFHESLDLNFTEVEWTYTKYNHDTGKSEGQVVGKYMPRQE